MGKGTPASGRHNKEGNHIRCRRCGEHSYHKKDKICAACGFGKTTKLRKFGWQTKTRPSYGRKAFNRRHVTVEKH